MKKLSIVLTSIMFLVGCSKTATITNYPEKVSVTIGYRMVEEVPLTKTVNKDLVSSWISENLPTELNLKLKNAEGETYTIKSGVTTELPCGEYTVTCNYKPTSIASVVASDVYLSSMCPAITISTTLNITYNQTTYTVPATYNAFGIVVDLEETQSATFTSSHGETGTINFSTIGTNIGFVFVNGNLSTHSINVTLIPLLEGYKETTHMFQTSIDPSVIVPNTGYYYILHPREIDSVEGGTISYTITGFCGVDVTD